jgi:hypothetical protein
MGKWVALISLGLTGVIVADVLKNPAGTQAASQGAQGIEKPLLDAMLGATS